MTVSAKDGDGAFVFVGERGDVGAAASGFEGKSKAVLARRLPGSDEPGYLTTVKTKISLIKLLRRHHIAHEEALCSLG